MEEVKTDMASPFLMIYRFELTIAAYTARAAYRAYYTTLNSPARQYSLHVSRSFGTQERANLNKTASDTHTTMGQLYRARE